MDFYGNFGPEFLINDFYYQKLLTLRQRSTVDRYKDQFQFLQSLVSITYPDIDEAYFASCCLNGLKDEIRKVVQLFRPVTVSHVLSLAGFQESILVVEAKIKASNSANLVNEVTVYPDNNDLVTVCASNTLAIELSSSRCINEKVDVTSDVEDQVPILGLNDAELQVNSSCSSQLPLSPVSAVPQKQDNVRRGVAIPPTYAGAKLAHIPVVHTHGTLSADNMVVARINIEPGLSLSWVSESVLVCVGCELLTIRHPTFNWEPGPFSVLFNGLLPKSFDASVIVQGIDASGGDKVVPIPPNRGSYLTFVDTPPEVTSANTLATKAIQDSVIAYNESVVDNIDLVEPHGDYPYHQSDEMLAKDICHSSTVPNWCLDYPCWLFDKERLLNQLDCGLMYITVKGMFHCYQYSAVICMLTFMIHNSNSVIAILPMKQHCVKRVRGRDNLIFNSEAGQGSSVSLQLLEGAQRHHGQSGIINFAINWGLSTRTGELSFYSFMLRRHLFPTSSDQAFEKEGLYATTKWASFYNIISDRRCQDANLHCKSMLDKGSTTAIPVIDMLSEWNTVGTKVFGISFWIAPQLHVITRKKKRANTILTRDRYNGVYHHFCEWMLMFGHKWTVADRSRANQHNAILRIPFERQQDHREMFKARTHLLLYGPAAEYTGVFAALSMYQSKGFWNKALVYKKDEYSSTNWFVSELFTSKVSMIHNQSYTLLRIHPCLDTGILWHYTTCDSVQQELPLFSPLFFISGYICTSSTHEWHKVAIISFFSMVCCVQGPSRRPPPEYDRVDKVTACSLRVECPRVRPVGNSSPPLNDILWKIAWEANLCYEICYCTSAKRIMEYLVTHEQWGEVCRRAIFSTLTCNELLSLPILTQLGCSQTTVIEAKEVHISFFFITQTSAESMRPAQLDTLGFVSNNAPSFVVGCLIGRLLSTVPCFLWLIAWLDVSGLLFAVNMFKQIFSILFSFDCTGISFTILKALAAHCDYLSMSSSVCVTHGTLYLPEGATETKTRSPQFVVHIHVGVLVSTLGAFIHLSISDIYSQINKDVSELPQLHTEELFAPFFRKPLHLQMLYTLKMLIRGSVLWECLLWNVANGIDMPGVAVTYCFDWVQFDSTKSEYVSVSNSSQVVPSLEATRALHEWVETLKSVFGIFEKEQLQYSLQTMILGMILESCAFAFYAMNLVLFGLNCIMLMSGQAEAEAELCCECQVTIDIAVSIDNYWWLYVEVGAEFYLVLLVTILMVIGGTMVNLLWCIAWLNK